MCKTAALRLLIACAGSVAALPAASECRADIADTAGYKVLRAIPNVRWGSGLEGGLPVKPGDPYTQANVNAARDYVRREIERQESLALRYLDRVSFRLIQPCTIVEQPTVCRQELKTDKCVTLRIDVLALHVPAIGASGFLLDKPRSPVDTNLPGVPAALLALEPRFGLVHDSGLGAAARLETSTDLALARKVLSGQAPASGATETNVTTGRLATNGMRSLNAPYYRGLVDLSVDHIYNSTIKQLGASATFRAATEPFGVGRMRSNELNVGLTAVISTSQPIFRSILAKASYDHAAKALSGLAIPQANAEEGTVLRAATDGVLFSGPIRISAWFQYGAHPAGAYRKVVLRGAYQKYIRIKPHQTLGLEMLTGWGRVAGILPAYDLFVGGSAGSEFLYEPLSSPAGSEMPAGPVIRSFGVGKLNWSGITGTVASESFFHFNGTVSIPVGVSRPLLPHYEPFPGVTIGDLLKARVDKDHLLEAVLKQQGYTEAAARAEEERVMKAIRPAVHFIADDANLWSIKPIVLFDVAHVDTSHTWTALGAGFQAEIVTAQFQVAYTHTLPGAPLPHSGNFILRLIFQNLF